MLTLQQAKDRIDDLEVELIYANQTIQEQKAYIDRLNEVIDALEYALNSASGLGEEADIGCSGIDVGDMERNY